MKKVRIMLVAIAVLAISGATLAFNAKFTQEFCSVATTTLPNGNPTCTVSGVDKTCAAAITTATTTNVNSNVRCIIPTTDPDNCPNVACPNVRYLTAE